jgi:hypothetical protein
MMAVHIALALTGLAFLILTLTSPKNRPFYLGSGHYGAVISGVAIVAAFTGGGALLNTSHLASKYGQWAFFDVFPSVLGLMLTALLVFGGFFGGQFSKSFFDVSSKIYDRRAVLIHYAQVAFLYTLVIAAQFRAVATIAPEMNIPVGLAVFLTGALVVAYAHRGFDAVTRTDVLQLFFMLPLYVIVAYIAFEQMPTSPLIQPATQSRMPLSLIIALCLPLLFLPISQEVHQRSAAAASDRKLLGGVIIAALVYGCLGSLIVVAFSRDPSITFASLISGPNAFAAIVVSVGLFAAVLSTLDTSTNIASHALQKLPRFGSLPKPLSQAGLIATGAILFLYFPTVLSLILFALFVYMAGPALTFVAVFAGLHPRTAGTVGAAFVTFQTIFQFSDLSGLVAPPWPQWLAAVDSTQAGISLLLLQGVVLLVGLTIKKLR